jgi:CHAT domain-containing protein/predicted negative regulator of RcsB-dependent stress response
MARQWRSFFNAMESLKMKIQNLVRRIFNWKRYRTLSIMLLVITFLLTSGVLPVRSQDKFISKKERFAEVKNLYAIGNYSQACYKLFDTLQIQSQICDGENLLEQVEVNKQMKKIADEINKEPSYQPKALIFGEIGQIMHGLGKSYESQFFLARALEITQDLLPEIKGALFLNSGNILRSYSNRIKDLEYSNQQIKESGFTLACSKLKGFGKIEDFLSEAQTCYSEALQITENTESIIWPSAKLNLLSLMVDRLQLLKESQKFDASTEERKKYQELSIEIENEIDKISEIITRFDQLRLNRKTIYAELNLVSTLLKYAQVSNKLEFLELDTISAKLQKGRVCAMDAQNRNLDSIRIRPRNSNQLALLSVGLMGDIYRQSLCLEDKQVQSYISGSIGNLYKVLSQEKAYSKNKNALLKNALLFTEDALYSIQPSSSPAISYRWQAQVGDILVEQGGKKAAIPYYEASVETLKNARKDLLTIDSEVQFSFRDDVEPVYRKLVDLLLQDPNQENLNKSRNFLQLLKQAELENLLKCSLQSSTKISLDNILDRDRSKESIQSREALIYPIVLKDRLEIILKLPSDSHLYHPKPLILQSSTEVSDALRAFRESIVIPVLDVKARESSKIIYEWLIRPIEAELTRANVNTLVFLLDAPFRNIPLGTLYDGKDYLIKKYAIAVTSGLNISPAKRSDKLKVIFAGMKESALGYRPLKNLEQQFSVISSQIPTIDLSNFTVKALEDSISSSSRQVVHIATHGEFSSQPGKTFLVAFDKPIGVGKLSDIFRKRSRTNSKSIELLVLAACETAKGDSRAALGLAGVAVRSEARSTLATLWKVPADSSSTELFKGFYKYIQDGKMTKVQALQRAQLDLIQSDDPNLSRPFFWGAYTLVENWL